MYLRHLQNMADGTSTAGQVSSGIMVALSRLYATCPDPKIRNGAKAVDYATRACELTKWTNSSNLDMLAGAYYYNATSASSDTWLLLSG
jgi:hypothetical protein